MAQESMSYWLSGFLLGMMVGFVGGVQLAHRIFQGTGSFLKGELR